MTYKYDNVYVIDTATVSGPLEKKGNFGSFFDKSYDDYYFSSISIEQGEVQLFNDAMDILLKKTNKLPKDIDLLIAGDLSNQIAVSCYGAKKYKIPFFGVYNACATTMEEVIIGASLIDGKKINNCICTTTSHNLLSEKQFRNPIEYGAPKKKSATFTSTGGASILLSNEKSKIKVISSTIGNIVDMNFKDANNVGAAMAPACGDVIYKHLLNLKEKAEDYDLILSGDLGIFGSLILKDYMKEKYNIILDQNYNDCGAILYDMKNQKEITAGGSGPVCSALVNYSFVFKRMKEKKLKRVLLVTTGALYNPIFLFQHQSILGIAHAVSFEVV